MEAFLPRTVRRRRSFLSAGNVGVAMPAIMRVLDKQSLEQMKRVQNFFERQAPLVRAIDWSIHDHIYTAVERVLRALFLVNSRQICLSQMFQSIEAFA